MSKLSEFRAELRNRAADFATSYQLASGSELKTQKQKDELNDKAYEKLEKFILEEFNTWIIDSTKKQDAELEINPEDTTLQLDF